MTSPATMDQIQEYFEDHLKRVSDMDGMLKTIAATQATMAKAHSDVGTAFTMMAKTFEKVEERQSQLETNNLQLYKDKGIPPNIFFTVVGSLAVVLILGATWITNTFIKASFTSFEAGVKQNTEQIQTSIKQSEKEILDEIR